ncbi:MAG: FG-GAP repeat protein [Carbonactinosporaceae bacterium]
MVIAALAEGGSCLRWADFDGDGYDDLAVGELETLDGVQVQASGLPRFPAHPRPLGRRHRTATVDRLPQWLS